MRRDEVKQRFTLYIHTMHVHTCCHEDFFHGCAGVAKPEGVERGQSEHANVTRCLSWNMPLPLQRMHQDNITLCIPLPEVRHTHHPMPHT